MDKEKGRTKVLEKISHWKLIAEDCFEKGKGIMIRDVRDNFYFAYIVLIGEEKITIDCYGPKKRNGLRFCLKWIEVIDLDEDKNKLIEEGR